MRRSQPHVLYARCRSERPRVPGPSKTGLRTRARHPKGLNPRSSLHCIVVVERKVAKRVAEAILEDLFTGVLDWPLSALNL
jgi:hypothetical protein